MNSKFAPKNDSTLDSLRRAWKLGAGFLLVSLVAVGVSAQARSVRSAPAEADDRIEIHHLNIMVFDLSDTTNEIPSVQSGDTVVVEAGKKMRLRMQGLPRKNATRGARYPSALFTPDRPLTFIRPIRTSEEMGSFTFTVEQGEPGTRQVIDYELQRDETPIPDELRRGRVVLELADAKTTAAADPMPQARLGVTLYEDSGFRGRAERLFENDPNLRDNLIGNDRLSSIRLDEGCVVRIFADSEYRGEYAEITFDVGDLDRQRVGNDEASSIQIDCRDDRDGRNVRFVANDNLRDDRDRRDGRDERDFRRGITLYEDSGYRGRTTFLPDGAYADLDRTEVGNDRATSITVSAGCVAILYRDSNFRGESIEVDRNLVGFGETRLGNDSLSSVRVICR